MPRLRANYKFTVFHTYHPFFGPEIASTDASMSAASAIASVDRGKVSENEKEVRVT
jgi:hypothetical protein